MSEDDDNASLLDDLDVADFNDAIAQRVVAFVLLARFSETVSDGTVQEITLSMMRKVVMSIKTPSTAELKVV